MQFFLSFFKSLLQRCDLCLLFSYSGLALRDLKVQLIKFVRHLLVLLLLDVNQCLEHRLQVLVLDEADLILSYGHSENVRGIVSTGDVLKPTPAAQGRQ